ncbi:cytochrome P450 [Bdellovibrio sp. BCCA]|uniref:cytochrome P450 n=1 Tax=Bdellovibrio sp. BCCA TaxID=3136281 RepID=UPI0030EFBC73
MDLYSQKIQSTPTEFANYLNGKGPIFWSEPEQFWVITDHALAQEALKSSQLSADRGPYFMSKMSGCPFSKVANFFGVVSKMMVNSDAPEHTRRRKLASAGISDHVIEHFAPQVKKVVAGLLEKQTSGTSVEFVSDVALPLPNIILADLFSIPAEKRPDFYRWANHMTQFFGGGSENLMMDAENADRGAHELRDYFTELIHSRRHNSANDFISHLLRNQGNLDDSEVISQAAIMLVAGTVTTTDQICNNLYSLIQSNVWPLLVKDRSLLENAIEEATRLDPAVNFIFRIVKEDMTLGGKQIDAGQLIFVSTHATNRAAEVFPDANSFNLERERNPHLSYGSGIHYCLGARLGRIQMKELFGQMLERYPQLTLDSTKPSQRKHQSLAFSGFETLHLQLGI